ncbi:MAG: hypothetical protein M0T86_03735 [Betaproteobacteria bacterium]|nr:hypothetical protein [Betaproteobacteria bacterium]
MQKHLAASHGLRTWGVAFALLAATTAHASTVKLDFSTYAPDTAIQSLSGITFSLTGNGGPFNAPVTGLTGEGLANADAFSPDYGFSTPADNLVATFGSLASNVSFIFDNIGTSASSYTAYDQNGHAIVSGSLGNDQGNTLTTVAASGIHAIVFNNGSGNGPSNDWLFTLYSLNADLTQNGLPAGIPTDPPADPPAAPLPASLPLMLSGLGMLGYAGRRTRNATH